ncbi:MAG: lipid IV(A) 3-deoxy-D-manno-octulosonic acid transferase [Steroidobacteraceae bacterium]
MQGLYTLLLRLATPFAIAFAWWHGVRSPELRTDIAQRLGRTPPVADAPVWIHAVSVGEVQAIAGVLAALRIAHPQIALLLTTATPTGMARAKALYSDDVQLRYAPFDLPGAARRFLERTRPCMALFVETELWPNLIAACAAREIPIALISARVSERSKQRYLRFVPQLMRVTVSRLALIAAQSRQDAVRFAALGARAGCVHITGNIKFDVRLPGNLRARATELSARYARGRPVWVAGSTHAVEEEQLLDAHRQLIATVPDALLVLVPRHPQRFDAVARLLESSGVSFVRRSTQEDPVPGTQVVLVDSLGELLVFYALADVAFVGGSLVPVGGHNLLEPAALGMATLSGPHVGNAPDIARVLTAAQALVLVEDAASLARQLARLLPDAAARQRLGAAARATVEANRGAVARTLALLEAPLRAMAVPGSAPEPPAAR